MDVCQQTDWLGCAAGWVNGDGAGTAIVEAFAANGHALAAGAILLMCSDLRIGSRGDYRIGLPEVTIGMCSSSLPAR